MTTSRKNSKKRRLKREEIMEQREMYHVGLINWNAPLSDFISQVDDMIGECIKNGRVIPLPIHQLSGHGMVEQIAMFNASVNCEGCNAICCRQDKQNPTVSLIDKEYWLLEHIFGKEKLDSLGIKAGQSLDTENFSTGSWDMPLPCPFYKPNGHKCSIYEHRPSTCIMYPVQFGAKINNAVAMAVCSSCPEARRLARKIYVSYYKISRAPLIKDGLEAIKSRTVEA